MNLGDLFFALRGDSQQLIADAKKGADQAGVAGGKSFGDQFKAQFTKANIGKAISVGLGAALAFATSRLVEIDTAVARFTATTGATEEQAKAAGQAINDMAGKNLQPIAEIGDALAAVTTNMGLQGDEAVALTQRILDYATATGQDAVAATGDLDDLMDRFGLTTADVSDVMDALVANTQKYGGSVAAQQKALSDLQPVLAATNASWQDGVALLGFFETAGIDSAQAAAGLTRAVKLLKPGQTIQDLFDEISAIGPAADRTKEAVRLFGRGAGPQLAAALGDGAVSLDDFALSAEDMAGAVTDAAGAIKDTLPNQIKLGFQNAATAIADFMGPAGPVLSSVGSLGLLLGPALGKVWGKVAGSSAVKIAAGVAGAAAATAYSIAAAAVETIATHLVSAWNAIPGIPRVTAALKTAGATMGRLLAGAIGLAITGALFASEAMAPIIQRAVDTGDMMSRAIDEGLARGMDKSAAIKRSVAIWDRYFDLLGEGLDPVEAEKQAGAWVDAAAAAIVAGGPALGAAVLAGLGDVFTKVAESGEKAGEDAGLGYANTFGFGIQRGGLADLARLEFRKLQAAEAEHAAQVLASQLEQQRRSRLAAADARTTMLAETNALVWAITVGSSAAWDAAWQSTGPLTIPPVDPPDPTPAQTVGDLFAAIGPSLKSRSSELRQTVTQIMADLRYDIAHPFRGIGDALFLMTAAGSKAIRKGLNSENHEIRADAQARKEWLLAQSRELTNRATLLAFLTSKGLERGLNSQDPDIRAKWKARKQFALDRLNELKAAAPALGRETTAGYGRGLSAADAIAIVTSALNTVATAVFNFFRPGSPTKLGPMSRDGGVEAWGRRIPKLLGKGVLGGLGEFQGAMDRVAGVASLGLTPMSLSASLAGGIGPVSVGPAVVRHEHHITREGAANLRAEGYDERGVAGFFLAGMRRTMVTSG